MGVDEEGTYERLKAHLAELVNPKIAERRGRIVKNTGDGFLAEFASVVDAVRCAAEVQRGMAERNADAPAGERIEFRVGINLGDVIVEEHDIFGDGVNVAARLEALAEPAGSVSAGVVRDQVRDRLDCAFEDLGEQSVKNIARPVRVYTLRSKARPVCENPAFRPPFRVRRVLLRHASRSSSFLYKPRRQLRTTVFRGWHHRGPHDRLIADLGYVRDLAQYRLHVPEHPDTTTEGQRRRRP